MIFTNEEIVTGSVDVNNFPATQTVTGTVTANAGTGPFPVSDNGGSLTVDGTVAVSGSVAVTGPLTDTQLRATPVPISGTVSIGAASSIATVTSISVSTTVATLSASNAGKTKVLIHNEAGTLHVKLGTGATTASYSYRLTANTSLEITGYTGIVTAIKASGTSVALVTEVGI